MPAGICGDGRITQNPLRPLKGEPGVRILKENY
jgi:hypothetical protein